MPSEYEKHEKQSRPCPALLISAPASGQGKTTFTAALARLHRCQGRQVRVFKCGPDFLDPQILECASGNPVYQLDLWIQGPAECRRLLWQAASTADLILIEGAMGLFDGNPSAADLAEAFAIPVLAVIDASSMAATFSAVAFGLQNYRPALPFAGVFANRLGSERHRAIVENSLAAARPPLKYYDGLPRLDELALPSRHLGLVQAREMPDLDQRLDRAASRLAQCAALVELPVAVQFDAPPGLPVPSVPPAPPASPVSPVLAGIRIGIARDEAFSFIYQANLDLLRALGAELVFFSPLRESLPALDSLYLPGGYPELHLATLRDNQPLLAAMRKHHKAGKPILAEGGGMLLLLESLTSDTGESANLAGLLPGRAWLQKKLAGLGSQEAPLPEGILRGHTFHHSRLDCALEPLARATHPDGRPGEAVYRQGRLTASYIHLYFPSNPVAACRLLAPDVLKEKPCQP